MSIRPGIPRSARRLVNDNVCIFCLHRASPPSRRYATATKYRLDPTRTPQEIRTDIDKRNRHAYYRMLQADKLLPCKIEDTNKIIHQFIVNSKTNMDPATNARNVAKQFKMEVIHLPMLAIPLYRIPDVNDSKAQLPPSQSPLVATAILNACSAAGDVQATLQILNAVYYSQSGYDIPQAAAIARHFTPNDISKSKAMLEKLAEGTDGKIATSGDPNAMTLHAKFLELAGQKPQARYFYEKALEKYNTKIWPGYPHPMGLPWLKPWTELVSLERSSPSPSPEKMKKALEFGALKADDPLAYYHLALLQESKSPDWLTYMSKAAASGHSEAMYQLGDFYLRAAEQPSAIAASGFRKALHFITSWKKGNVKVFGTEWLEAAGMGGHKPALIALADVYEGAADKEEGVTKEVVRHYLRRVLEEPHKEKKEQWPQLVEQARRRLMAM